MQKPLTEKEIEFCEFFSDPTALTENLIPENFNAPQIWDEEEQCIYVRPYQTVMQNFSYMYANDPNLSKKENFRIKKGAGDSYQIGSRDTGKCEWIENYCQLANGSLKKFGDLIGKNKQVISFNEKTCRLEKDVAYFEDNGIKPCYKIILNSGKEIIVTENHPLLTEQGWRNSSELKEDSFIATPRKINIYSYTKVKTEEAKLIGYLLGDGGCTGPNIAITNTNDEIIEEIYDLANHFNCKIRKQGISYFFSKKKILTNFSLNIYCLIYC